MITYTLPTEIKEERTPKNDRLSLVKYLGRVISKLQEIYRKGYIAGSLKHQANHEPNKLRKLCHIVQVDAQPFSQPVAALQPRAPHPPKPLCPILPGQTPTYPQPSQPTPQPS